MQEKNKIKNYYNNITFTLRFDYDYWMHSTDVVKYKYNIFYYKVEKMIKYDKKRRTVYERI